MNLIRSDEAPATLLDFSPLVAQSADALAIVRARAQNFLVQWVECGVAPGSMPVTSGDEMLVLIASGALSAASGSYRCEADGSAAVILRPGTWRLDVSPGTRLAVLSSLREPGAQGEVADAGNAMDAPVNAADYERRDPALKGVGRPYRRQWGAAQAQVLRMADVRASPDKPRLKMLQTATMSINWVEYDGPRDRSALSPHAHDDFEQGSLAIAGEFVHHLRAEWGTDAGQWKADAHARVGSPSLMVVPARTIHTSEGVGPGRHLLVDIFSPPRQDFIARGWVFNAGDYSREADA